MKICVVSDYLYPSMGGIAEHTYNYSKYAIKLGHNVRVITPYPTKYTKKYVDKLDEVMLPGAVIRLGKHLPVFSNGSLSMIGIAWNIDKKLKAIFEKEKFDVIHIQSPLAGFIPMLAIKYSNTLTIGTIQTYFKNNFWFNTFKKFILRYYDALDGCISVSENSRDLISGLLNRTPFVINNAIDVNIFGKTSEKIERFNDEKVNVFFIGRPDVRNGIDFLIKAFLEAIKEYKNMRLIVAGDGPYLNYYKNIVPKEHFNDICFVGSISNEEKPIYYNTADIHAFPAEIAAHSVTILEGLAAGKPIITSDNKSFRDVITPGKEGFLVPYGNVDDLKTKILELAKDKSLREKMGVASRSRSMDFSWEVVTDKVIKFYKECHKKALNKYPLI
jgi:glycosyltransferase involved in cell wall biosynthesis